MLEHVMQINVTHCLQMANKISMYVWVHLHWFDADSIYIAYYIPISVGRPVSNANNEQIFICIEMQFIFALNEGGNGLETYMPYAMTQNIGLAIIKTNVIRCQRIFLFIFMFIITYYIMTCVLFCINWQSNNNN